jgi:hypothetical protein
VALCVNCLGLAIETANLSRWLEENGKLKPEKVDLVYLYFIIKFTSKSSTDKCIYVVLVKVHLKQYYCPQIKKIAVPHKSSC